MVNINLVYSGGVQNEDPNSSLGGFPSPTPVVNNMKNNLFDDVSPQETTQGRTDYRCLYVFNDNPDIKFAIKLYFEYLDDIGATVQLGFFSQNAVQSLKFNEIPSGGTFTITVQGLKSDTITWDNDVDVLATNIQTAIQSVSDCLVSVVTPGQFIYNITFKGVLGNKSLTLLSVTDNNLTPGVITFTVQQILPGSPINTVAPDTGFENLQPNGIPFFSILAPGVEIGTLYPSEGFPVWVRRVVSPGFEAVEGDGFIMHTDAVGTSVN